MAITARGAALGTLLAVLFLTFLDTTIVSVTLGDFETDISAGVIPLQWVINAYALVFASLMLLGGSLGDRLGRKRVMVGGVVIFALGSILCAVANDVSLVIAGRAVMGLGAAASEPGTLSIIRQLYPDRRERARALGGWSAISGLALALGPVIGGLLVGAGGWRWVFWFNLILAVALLGAVAKYVPESRDPAPGRLDLLGFVLATAGLFGVIYAAIAGEYQGYGTWWVIGLFVAGGLCLLAFGPVEARAERPMLDLRSVRRPVVGSALFAAFAVYFGVFAIFFLTAIYLDIGLHYSGWKLAGMFTPMAVAIVGGGLIAGRWVARSGSRIPLTVGCALGALGTVLGRIEVPELSTPAQPADPTAFTLMALALALAGLGFGITVVPLTSAVLSHIPARMSGMAASATNTARQLGAVVGVAVLGAIVNQHLRDEVERTFGSGFGALLGDNAKEKLLQVIETGGTSGSFDINDIPKSFITAFREGLQVGLVVATVLIALAGIAAFVVREPPVEVDDEAEAEVEVS